VKKALVTGHQGFVGRHVMNKLWKRGYEVGRADLKSGLDCRNLFKTETDRFDLVIHLAAIVGGRATIEGHPLSVADDLSIDAEFFQWAMRTKPKQIVYYSSSAAYPTRMQGLGARAVEFKLREEDISLDNIETPDLTYGWAKLTGEMLAKYAQEAGLKVYVFRPFSGYGEDQDLTYPFPSFIDRARRYADPFEIWGDGNQARDFIHIEDVVNATFEALDNDVSGPVNLCTGRATTFNDLARMVTNEAGYEPEFKHHLDAPVGVQYRVGDPTKLRSFYTPTISLEEGIRRALHGER
jgi:nucleoside-diphosphate-sugar epimerase